MSGSKNTKKTPNSQPGPIDRDKAVDTASADESAIKASVLPSDQSAALADQVDTDTSETVHPKESKKEALALLKCHSKNLTFEPVCLDPFNDARECLFRLDG